LRALPANCTDCPARLNAPETHEGRQVWDIVKRMGHQLRIADRGLVVGFDFPAAFELARALGVPEVAVAEFLPEIEAVAVARMRGPQT
jgi:hypothetical protein